MQSFHYSTDYINKTFFNFEKQNYCIMKKVLIFVAACFITAGAMAQLKVESNGDVVFPNYGFEVQLGGTFEVMQN